MHSSYFKVCKKKKIIKQTEKMHVLQFKKSCPVRVLLSANINEGS